MSTALLNITPSPSWPQTNPNDVQYGSGALCSMMLSSSAEDSSAWFILDSLKMCMSCCCFNILVNFGLGLGTFEPMFTYLGP